MRSINVRWSALSRPDQLVRVVELGVVELGAEVLGEASQLGPTRHQEDLEMDPDLDTQEKGRALVWKGGGTKNN
jgi:hypothetical protein